MLGNNIAAREYVLGGRKDAGREQREGGRDEGGREEHCVCVCTMRWVNVMRLDETGSIQCDVQVRCVREDW